MVELTCKGPDCGRTFRAKPSDIRKGDSSRPGEWSFLAICPRCGRCWDFVIPTEEGFNRTGCPI